MKIKILKIRLNEEFQMKDEIIVNEFLQENQILRMTSQIVNDKQPFWSILLRYAEKNTTVEEPKIEDYAAEPEELMTPDEIKMLDSLKLWRSEKAKENNIPHYMIASNKELLSVVRFKPAKKEELIEIKGFGKYKIENFGSEIIEILEEL